ncbi:carboxypeptidase S1-like protein B [Xylariaceae sp. FL0804]|nr:carboxypeptidase S1-like protein B [Xylariaceae sp. FL0804]
MLSATVLLAAGLPALAPVALAQFPPAPENVTVLQSKFGDGVTISYKEPGLCETTPGVKSYAGYVHLPPGSLADLGEPQDYPINTFFWFFEARSDPANAPLSIWLNGGPGSSSMLGLLAENGPCYVNADQNSTTLNPWSWNNEVNMLYIDQPVQTGFSYDVLQNVTSNLVTGDITLLNTSDPIPAQNETLLVGTYSSQNVSQVTTGSTFAAIAFWHFAQAWFQEFPAYQPNDSRVNLATESYGGRYGPRFAALFETQNRRIANGSFAEKGEGYIIHLDTLLQINSCIDRQTQWPAYPHIAYNNTYGIQAVNESVYEQMTDALYRNGGCRDQVAACESAAALYDPDDRLGNATVNDLCAAAEDFCIAEVRDPYVQYSGRNYYDYGTLDPDPFPAAFYSGYLNRPHVQRALGVPVNFTPSSAVVSTAFRAVGDYPRPGWLADLAGLLDDYGVKVHLAYGDRDYACNWLGGEAVSLAVNYSGAAAFRQAGYADLVVNGTGHVGGQTRQRGNFSFSRVYEAGHEVPAYQPEAAYRVFSRALAGRDIATGAVDTTATDADYATSGPADTWSIKNDVPPQPVHYCYLWDIDDTCTDDQTESILNGSAVIVNGILKDENSTQLFPELFGGSNSTPTATSTAGTGSSSATSSPTPTESGNAANRRVAAEHWGLAFWTVVAAVAQAVLV